MLKSCSRRESDLLARYKGWYSESVRDVHKIRNLLKKKTIKKTVRKKWISNMSILKKKDIY